ncbi:hypothetical protein Q5752_001227 [Cryptotrichosporon argae]
MAGFLAKIEAKLKGHKDTNPATATLYTQRDELLAVTPETPVERKSHFTHEAVAAAAAYEAFKAFENHESVKGDTKPTHARAKEIIAGLASGYAVKLIEEKGLPFSSQSDKEAFVARAQQQAARDAKRGLRESGHYSDTELEPIEEDEKTGHQAL